MVGALLMCFVLVSLCWFVLWVGLKSNRPRPALKALGGCCYSVLNCMYVVAIFEDNMWVGSFVGF